jgi:hypothetical protein
MGKDVTMTAELRDSEIIQAALDSFEDGKNWFNAGYCDCDLECDERAQPTKWCVVAAIDSEVLDVFGHSKEVRTFRGKMPSTQDTDKRMARRWALCDKVLEVIKTEYPDFEQFTFGQATESWSPATHVGYWNDTPGRTYEEVEQVLTKVRNKAEEEGN